MGCGLSMSAAYTQVFMVAISFSSGNEEVAFTDCKMDGTKSKSCG